MNSKVQYVASKWTHMGSAPVSKDLHRVTHYGSNPNPDINDRAGFWKGSGTDTMLLSCFRGGKSQSVLQISPWQIPFAESRYYVEVSPCTNICLICLPAYLCDQRTIWKYNGPQWWLLFRRFQDWDLRKRSTQWFQPSPLNLKYIDTDSSNLGPIFGVLLSRFALSSRFFPLVCAHSPKILPLTLITSAAHQ